MNINTDINILGGLPDFDLIKVFLNYEQLQKRDSNLNSTITKIKTEKSVKRFEKAINNTFLSYVNSDVEYLVLSMLGTDGITNDSRLLLFWNASMNNDLLNYLNTNVFFPAYYSGRLILKQDEVLACLKDLKSKSPGLDGYSEMTLKVTASKYLTLLKKFTLLEGTISKTIAHPYLNDKMLMFFVYWLSAIEKKSNVLASELLQYSFNEERIFVERVMQKKYSKFINITFSGDKLTIQPLLDYKNIYNAITKS